MSENTSIQLSRKMPQRYDPIHDVLVGDEDKTPVVPIAEEKEDDVVVEEPKQEPNQQSSTEVKEEENELEMKQAERATADLESKDDVSHKEVEEMKDPDGEHVDSPKADIPPQSEGCTEIGTEGTTVTSTEQTEPANGKKHKRSPSPTKFQLKKTKKQTKSATVLSSARSRHLKKDDGKPFLRKDIQYQFLKELFGNKVRAFTDPYPESRDKVMTEPEDEPNHKLTFAELYIKTIAHSSKCSKILRDRLLNDMQMSIPTSMICLLVNVGRMNTTINFVPDMKSQLRTYHSIPCLQVDYDASDNKYAYNGNGGDKQLQDTPRLKSILKACCDDTDEPNALALLEKTEKIPKTSIINIIFLLCNAEESVTKRFLEGTGYSFFDIFMNSDYDPNSRANLFMWLLYSYLETHLDEAGINSNPFGPGGKPETLTKPDGEFDQDTPAEIEFGERLYNQRVKFIAEDDGSDAQARKEERAEKKKHASETPVKHKSSYIPKSERIAQANSKLTHTSSGKHTIKFKNEHSNINQPAPFQFPPLPKPDIDTKKVRTSIKYLARMSGKKRARIGQVKYEHQKIDNGDISEVETNTTTTGFSAPTTAGTGASVDEGTPAPAGNTANGRMRLKNYKGDYVENSEKFAKLMNLLKNDFVEMTKADQQTHVDVQIQYSNPEVDLTLKSFSVDI